MGFLFPFLPSVAGEAFVVDRLCLQSGFPAVFLKDRGPAHTERPLAALHHYLPSSEEWTKDVRLSAQVTGSWSFSRKPL
ncbi:unnamed protein product, partial [Rangifer tarandus platyrhynchus]